MNIICNSCVGSRLYELCNKEFNNPFMWNVIPYPDFKRLIQNYDNIYFRKFNVSIFQQSESNWVSQAIFDSLVKTYYIHYHQDARFKRPTKNAIDIYSDNIIGYTEDAIKRRLDRMESSKERPIFLFETRNRNRYNGVYTERDIDNFINLNTPYTKILLVNQSQYKNSPELVGNTHVLYYEDVRPDLPPPDTQHMALEVYNKFKELIV